MNKKILRSLLLSVSLCASSAYAHEVHHSVATNNAVVVQLTYADGKPFAYEAYEATPDGATVPTQVGRTDAQGRALFIPDKIAHWKFKAYTTDGHGVSLQFDAPTIIATPTATDTSNTPSRLTLMLFGLSLIFFAFGCYQLWIRKKK